ncbi:MAG: polysaccharide deacetylase family protein [Saprospiraceae bacterium]|nr:polysaccharide deacetylase family protein [Saprospiraceae bacterium]
MTTTVLFFSEKITPRLRYTVATIIGNLSGLDFIFTQDKSAFLSADLPKINYSKMQICGKELRISPHPLLFDNSIQPYLIESENDFFINPNNNNLVTELFNFDVFARIFFLVSRYEEYNCPTTLLDAYQRFSSTLSVASKLGFLQQPIVNQYIIQLSKQLKNIFPNLKTQFPTYKFQPTFDIDMAWTYKNKGILRNSGGFLQDILSGRFNSIRNRANILRGINNDPYYTFEYIKKLHQSHDLKPVVFWLLGDLAKYDKNIDWTVPEFQTLIQSFAKDFRVGIHPSYRSNQSVSILKMEVERLENILSSIPPLAVRGQNTEGEQKTFPSRQHFLKLRFPDTYRRLIDVGIREDWTMGYADETGFRASIATPFPWFDLEKNEETPLIIHPFQAMDVTLNNYLRLTPEAALERLQSLMDTTKSVGGTFTTLWHNDNLAEMDAWKGWRAVYEKLLNT